jgi:hypothetical protein
MSKLALRVRWALGALFMSKLALRCVNVRMIFRESKPVLDPMGRLNTCTERCVLVSYGVIAECRMEGLLPPAHETIQLQAER